MAKQLETPSSVDVDAINEDEGAYIDHLHKVALFAAI